MNTTRAAVDSRGRGFQLTTRATPRISVNKLGEYTAATALGRQSIVRDQKFPCQFKTVRYDGARDAIVDYLVRPEGGTSGVLGEMERLSNAPARTQWAAEDNRLSIEALEHFLSMIDGLPFRSLSATRGELGAPRMDIEGVEVSVRPELTLRGILRGKPSVGAIKLRFSKSQAIKEEAAGNVTTVLQEYVERHVAAAEREHVSHRQCFLVDVFHRRCYEAPVAFRSRRRVIAAECREISILWSTAEDRRKVPDSD